jgi:uncharacterized protein (DUF2235 family)
MNRYYLLARVADNDRSAHIASTPGIQAAWIIQATHAAGYQLQIVETAAQQLLRTRWLVPETETGQPVHGAHFGTHHYSFGPAQTRLMQAFDQLNDRFGRGTVHLGSTGASDGPRRWAMRQERLSPQYTTRWSDLPWARA